MIEIQKKTYSLALNPRSGTVDRLAEAGDSKDVNLIHKSIFSGFGSLYITPKGKPWVLQDTKSPIGVDSYVFTEYQRYAVFEKSEDNSFFFRNPKTGHVQEYHFDEDSFFIRWQGSFSDADQIGVNLNMSFIDLRQNDPRENQFTLKSFYAGEDRELGYVYLARCGGYGRGILLYAPKHCAAWRLCYENSPYIPGMQFIYRFSEYIDPERNKEDEVDFTVCVSFHNSLDEAMAYLAEKEDLPYLDAPAKSVFLGGTLNFTVRSDANVTLKSPDGTLQNIPVQNGMGSVTLKQEGFYYLTARNHAGKQYELILHGKQAYLPLLERSRKHLLPIFRSFNAECFSWVQAMLVAHQYIGNDPRMTAYLHDALINVGMQGLPDCFPGPIPSPEETSQRMERPLPGRAHYMTDGKYLIGAPSPCEHEIDGIVYPKGHIYKWHRIQDGFAFVQTYLYAARAFQCNDFYEYAIEIARAHLQAHLAKNGRVEKYSPGEAMMIDYTTVISPLLAISELYEEMKIRQDPRADEFGEACIRIADFLLARGMEFPTEGIQAFLRWTEDGSISCTALSLLAAYLFVSPDPRYLDFAQQVLDFHESWHIRTNDARSTDTTFRFWETQWENEGEGHSVNCGHAWNLWRGEAMFYLGAAKNDAKSFQESWNTFQAVLCNHHPDGRATSCFTPDYIPRRPNKLKVYHCYPDLTSAATAFYVWPRLLRTWWKSTVVFNDPQFGETILNGKRLPDGNIFSYAPDPVRIYDLRQAGGKTIE